MFGAYASEAWKVHARFYGTGETAVFQLHPRQLLWRWTPLQGTANDYFQFSTHEVRKPGTSRGVTSAYCVKLALLHVTLLFCVAGPGRWWIWCICSVGGQRPVRGQQRCVQYI